MFRKMWFLYLALVLTACQGGPLLQSSPTATPVPPSVLAPTLTFAPTSTLVPTPTLAPTSTFVPTPTLAPTSTFTPTLTLAPTSTFAANSASFPEEFTGKAKIGDYTLTINCTGIGSPTVILEPGVYEKGWNYGAQQQYRQITRICMYNRVGQAGEVVTKPRTTLDQVRDLHALLEQTGVPGPYILAGYEFSGHNLVLYADQYPKDVAGLVCVDCAFIAPFLKNVLDKLGTDTSYDSPDMSAYRQDMTDYAAGLKYTWGTNPEHLDQLADDAQVLKVTSLGDKPFIVLEAENTFIGYSTFGPEADKLGTDASHQAQTRMCHLSSKCQVRVVPGVNILTIFLGDSVFNAIKEMYDAVKKQ